MAEASLSLEAFVRFDYSNKFVKRCADGFHWKDLSENVVMDIGCGAELNCCKAILLQFPDVRALIAVDKTNAVFQQARFRNRKIQFCVGDILDRASLKSYEGKMDKIISTNTFDEIIDKETAFRNVYRLLKPGGEAGFYFCLDSHMFKFLSVMSEIPKYGAIIEGMFDKNLYQPEHGKQYYKEMLEKIGFKNVRAFDEEKRFPLGSYEGFKDHFIDQLKAYFKLSPEAIEAFKAEVLELYEEKFGRTEGQFCYVGVLLNLLGVKPVGKSDSKSKEATVA